MATAAPTPNTLRPPPRLDLRNRGVWLGLAGLAIMVVLVVIAWRETGISLSLLAEGWSGTVDFLGDAIPPATGWDDVIKPGIDAALITLWTALLGTVFAIPLALLFGVLGARNTSPNAAVYQLVRSVMSALRAVPEVVFALIFVVAVGLGPFPGVLALVVHTIGVMGKLYSEAIEETDPGPADALRVAGASRAQQVTHAVIPAVTPTLVGLTLYRFDVNVRASLVLGLVGAGGIGFEINQAIKLFRFDEMFTFILIVLVMVIAVDLLSAWIRKRIA